ncbi:MAG: PRC-barrel domain-containing protein [Methanosphaera sp.]|nr:PRC-barrel domain-containing protein [Methanosphaera sp.]
MIAKEILGRKIIDKNAREVAKITEIVFDLETYDVVKIYGASGNPISKKYCEILPSDMINIGDYLLLNKTIDELESNNLDTLPKDNPKTISINNSEGKTVLDAKGNIAGKIGNIEIDLDELKLKELTVEKGSSFSKKTKNVISKDDIISNGDYIIINKVFDQPEEEKEQDETPEEKDD